MEKIRINHWLFLLASLLLYLGLAYLYFGVGILGHPDRIKGAGDDPYAYLWFLHWWGYAFKHRLNPFISYLIWAPNGYNVVKTPSIFGVYLMSLPLKFFTSTLGAYNIIAVFSPAIAAWSMLVCCFQLIRKRLNAWLGGYLFGFSSYMISQTCCHINLTAGVFLIPIIIWLVILLIQSRIRRLSATIAITLCLTLLFFISKEIVTTFTVCAAMALVIALFFLPPVKARIKTVLAVLLSSYFLLALLTSPFIYYFISSHTPLAFKIDSSMINNDLLAFFTPPVFMQFITHNTVALSQQFNGGAVEQVAYLGFPLILILILFIHSGWRQPYKRYLTILLLLYLFISLGSVLHLGGGKVITILPNKLFFALPFIRQSLANRYALYSSFVISIIVILWLNEASSRKILWGKYLLLVLALLTLLPCIKPIKRLHPSNAYPCYLNSDNGITFFSRPALYQQWLKPGDNVLIVPYDRAPYYQLQANFYFRVAVAYLGLSPIADSHNQVIALINQGNRKLSVSQLKQFIKNREISAIIIQRTPNILQPLLQQMGLTPIHTGGVWLYRIKPY